MSAKPWNHNIHYHDLLLRSVPPLCRRALDVGCGTGLLARKLAARCEEVVAIDAGPGVIAAAQSAGSADAGVTFIDGDAMTYPFAEASFDFIAAVAVLHHLPLEPALTRFRNLLRADGVLVVIGLYRMQSLADYIWAAAAFPVSRMLRWVRRTPDISAPLKEPRETLREIRRACEVLLPGSMFQRRLFFRYTLIWRKPPRDGCAT